MPSSERGLLDRLLEETLQESLRLHPARAAPEKASFGFPNYSESFRGPQSKPKRSSLGMSLGHGLGNFSMPVSIPHKSPATNPSASSVPFATPFPGAHAGNTAGDAHAMPHSLPGSMMRGGGAWAGGAVTMMTGGAVMMSMSRESSVELSAPPATAESGGACPHFERPTMRSKRNR